MSAEPHRHRAGEACFPSCPGWSTPAPGGRGYTDTAAPEGMIHAPYGEVVEPSGPLPFAAPIPPAAPVAAEETSAPEGPVLMTEPHDGHEAEATCPGCPHAAPVAVEGVEETPGDAVYPEPTYEDVPVKAVCIHMPGCGCVPAVEGVETVEWGLIVITSDGKTLLPEAEICRSREQAEERARQERSFGMTVIVASRSVSEWSPVEPETSEPEGGESR